MAKGKSIALLGPGHNSITELQAFIGSQTIEHWPIDRLKESERKLRRHSRRKINSLTRAFANFKIEHECYNWDFVNEWAKERSFDLYDNVTLLHPTLGTF